MTLDIQFVHFPKSREVQEIVEKRITETAEKYTDRIQSIHAFFSPDGDNTHIKFLIRGPHYEEVVEATDRDVAHTMEKVFEKFEHFMRKLSSKKKSDSHYKERQTIAEMKQGIPIESTRSLKRSQVGIYNEFDKYEEGIADSFETGMAMERSLTTEQASSKDKKKTTPKKSTKK